MADPARKWEEPEHTPGNSDSKPFGKSDLRSIEGDGESTPRNKDHLSDVSFGGEAAEQKEANLLGEGKNSPSFYKKSLNSSPFKAMGVRKKLLFGVGIGGAVAGGLTLLLFGFLNVFKLDHMMSNIDSKTFARLNGGLDNRSSKYINAYMTLRLADIGDNPRFDKPNDPDNLILRANRVDNNNPLFDWYKTMRTSKFEQEIFEKYGFKFVSVAERDGNQIKRRPGFIQNKEASTKEFIRLSPEEMDNVLKGNINELNGKLNKFVEVEAFANDKEGRQAIRRVVKDNTHWAEVFKRRQIRKSIQNMTGVRDWRFFEDKRNKFDEKKIEIRNKIISKAIPPTTQAGKFVNCLFGISQCKMHDDPSSPDNRADASLIETGKTTEDDVEVRDQSTGQNVLIDPETGEATSDSKKGVKPKVSLGPASDVAKRIASSIAPGLGVLNIVSILDSFVNVDSAIKSGAISKGVVVARGAQAMGFYQAFGTARDQIKSGEVQSAEVNEFMQVIGPISNSEGWNTVIDSKQTIAFTDSIMPKATAATRMAKQEYCSEKHQLQLEKLPPEKQGFAYQCPDKQIGGGSRAANLEKMYQDSVGGQMITPILGIYSGVRNAPIVGGLLTFANKLIGDISGAVTTFALSSLGLDDNVEKIIEKASIRLAGFLGAGPMMNGKEPAGVYANMIIQGGAYTSETTSRANGASLTTPVSAMAAKEIASIYQAHEEGMYTRFDKYLSLSNSSSLASSAVFGISQLSLPTLSASLVSFGDTFQNITKTMVSPFSARASAESEDIYRAAGFAGIETYDFPQECYNLNPIDATPSKGTNIQMILGVDKVPNSDLTWELVTNNDEWYSYVYEKLGNDENSDTQAKKIYNCHLLDTSVRGSLGYLYGYDKDNGLNEAVASSSDNADGTVVPVSSEGFVFPLRTSQSVIKAGVSGSIWCFSAQSSCHHDYFAADIHAPTGTPVVSPINGVVTAAKDSSKFPSSVGSRVSIKGDDGRTYYLTHLGRNTIAVRDGQRIAAGSDIGLIGTSADAQNTPPHLHIDGLPASKYNTRPSCGLTISCASFPFIDIQKDLYEAFNKLST